MAFDPWNNGFLIISGSDEDGTYEEEEVDAESLQMTPDEYDLRFGALNRKEFAKELRKRLKEIAGYALR